MLNLNTVNYLYIPYTYIKIHNQILTLSEMPKIKVMFNVGKVLSHVFGNWSMAVCDKGMKNQSIWYKGLNALSKA